MKCDICESTETYIKDFNHKYIIKNEVIEFINKRRFCKKCNNLIYDKELDNQVSSKAINMYNKKFGINKDDLVALRRSYNLSQELFAKIIGCAKKTIISYEQGKSIPNDSYLSTLKTLLAKPERIIDIIESNKDRFSEKEYVKIKRKIFGTVNTDNKPMFYNFKQEPTIYNGYSQFSIDKIKNIILILSNKSILKTKLLKEMFYIDFISYKETGASITGLEYSKINYGPVPDEYEKIINFFVKENVIDYVIKYDKDYEYHNILAKDKINTEIFNKKELEIIEKIKKHFQKYSSNELVEVSHKEKAFKNTDYYKKISYEYAFDINTIN